MPILLRFTGFCLIVLFFICQLNAQSDPISIAGEIVQAQAIRLGLNESDVAEIALSDFHQSDQNGTYHIYFQQLKNGLGIDQAVINIALSANLDLLQINSRFSNLSSIQLPNPSQAIEAEAALVIGLEELGYNRNLSIELIQSESTANRYTLFSIPDSNYEPIPAWLSYVRNNEGNLTLVWNLEFYTIDGNHFWLIKADALRGSVLSIKDLVLHCSFSDSHRVEEQNALPYKRLFDLNSFYGHRESEAPLDYEVFQMPVESPNHGSRTIVSNPSDPIASPFGWHDDDGIPGPEYSTTRGNNVFAKEDIAADNEGTIGYSPDPGLLMEYLYPFDIESEPEEFLDASITNLFFWNNLIHDVWYHYGFNEASGNFQQNNYGRGGLEEDEVQADAQDGSGNNNANFFTPAEPDSLNRKPRMQMFLWTGPGAGSKFLRINSPANIAGIYGATRALFGPELPPVSAPITEEVVQAISDGAISQQACGNILNPGELSGKIALIDVGGCAFTDKVQNAQDAGAIAVIVCFTFPGIPVTMGGTSTTITIPSIMVNQQTCFNIKNSLPGVNASVSKDPAGGPSHHDSSMDNGVIVHEYGHGISNRLTGGPAQRDCLHNQEQAGEGWSDWLGLMMTMKPTDSGEMPRGIGTYLNNEPIRGGGIRSYPYSTNMFVNPHTYRNIATEFAPHGSGSVMAAMLWDMTWAFIETYGFDNDLYYGTGGNNMAIQLVIDGMKLQPCEPGFVDARDAILMADEINYSGQNKCLIWEVFAKRGLGFSADQGNPDVRGDGIEGFDLPPSCIDELIIKKSVSSLTAMTGDTLTYSILVFNGTSDPLTNVIISDTLNVGLEYIPGSIDCGANLSGNVLNIPSGSLMPGDSIVCSFDAVVTDIGSTHYFFEDDADNGTSNWVLSHSLGTKDWEHRNTGVFNGTHAWFARNVDVVSDQILTMANPVTLSGENIRLRFAHNFRTEALYDAGVVEISADGGSWEDLGPHIIHNPYAGQVLPGSSLAGRDAFWGSSDGYQISIIDLDAYSGSNILIRFRFATDEILGNSGWSVDAIQIGNEWTLPNRACVNNDQGILACDELDIETLVFDPVTVAVEEPILDFKPFIYPNPSSGEIFIGYRGPLSDLTLVQIFDLNGSLIFQSEVESVDLANHYSVQLNGNPSGMYIVKLNNAQFTSVEKVIIH